MRRSWLRSGLAHAGAIVGLAVTGAGRVAPGRIEPPVIISTDMTPERREEFLSSHVVFSEPEHVEPAQVRPRVDEQPRDREPELTEVPAVHEPEVLVLEPVGVPTPLCRPAPRDEPRQPAEAAPQPVALRPSPRPARPAPGNPPPRYPSAARQAGVEGTVLVKLLVSERGEVESAEVARSSGSAQLDAAALAALRRWRFTPALDQGRPVQWEVRVPVRFVLTASG
jgi:protein TonB